MTVRMYHPDLDNWMITCSPAAAQVHALKGWIELPDEDPTPAVAQTETTESEWTEPEVSYASLDDIEAGASTEGRSTAPEDDATPAEDEEEEH